MRRWFVVLLLTLPLTLAYAEAWNLVRVPVPLNPAELEAAGFTLFHNAGDALIGSLPIGALLPEGGVILQDYSPQAGDLFRLSLPSGAEADKLIPHVRLLYRDDDEAIFQGTQEQLEALPVIRAEWVRITQRPKSLDYLGAYDWETDEFHPYVQQLVNQVSQTQYTQYLQSLQDFVTRNTRTTNCDNAAAWILSQFQSFGLNAYYDYFMLSGQQKRNVIGELTGLVHPDSIVFITAHYDATAGQPSVPEANAPGADDNGSGTACVLECARILAQTHFDKTIRFVAFAGEEQGLVGSEDYVSDLQAQGAHVVGSFNFDMIAYSGSDPPPPDFVLYANNNPRSQAMAYKVASACSTFTPNLLEPDITISATMTSSDHGPFWGAGWAAICGIEEQAWGPDFNPYYHTVNDLISNCDLVYATNCTKAALAALADYALPIPGTGPAVTIQNFVIDDLTGNQNGQPDPGETISLEVTLINVGTQTATGITGVFTSSSPYLTIMQGTATYPDLPPNMTGIGAPLYNIVISASCPMGTWVSGTLQISAGGGYQNTVPLNFQVGNPLYAPMGPDAYGYYAYDKLDLGGPTFNWMEIDPSAGGSGIQMAFTLDDQTIPLNLPFSFQYYGEDYTQISVCSNGWIAMGMTSSTDYSNSSIPNQDGPPSMISPFWDDLSPQVAGHICYYFNSVQHLFIVEYRGVRQYTPTWALETFEVVFYDPAYHITPTGDGKILFQYLDVSDPSSCTVGIENQAETMGLQYLYDGAYNVHAATIGDSAAILFMTTEGYPNVIVELTPLVFPIQIPATGGSFNYLIEVTNNDSDTQTFDVWCDVTLPNGSSYGPVVGPVNVTMNSGVSISRNRTQTVPATAPAGNYSYNGYTGIYPAAIYSEDSFAFTKLAVGNGARVEGWENWGEDWESPNLSSLTNTPSEFRLMKPYPNPFNAATQLSFQLPVASQAELKVYEVSGRLVTTVYAGWAEAGTHRVEFNGAALASGVYLYQLTAGEFQATGKMVLLK